MPSKKESYYQTAGREFAILHGWFCCKIEAPNLNGFPDYFYARNGVIVLAEWKTEDGVLSVQQVRRIKDLRKHRVTVHVFEGQAGLDEFKRIMK